MSSKLKREKAERDMLNIRFQHLTIYGRGHEDGTDCDLRGAASLLYTPMKQIAEKLEIGNGVAKINDYDVFQAKIG
jgi:hypothetical protein